MAKQMNHFKEMALIEPEKFLNHMKKKKEALEMGDHDAYNQEDFSTVDGDEGEDFMGITWNKKRKKLLSKEIKTM
jgi:ferredoxin-NADP reductase